MQQSSHVTITQAIYIQGKCMLAALNNCTLKPSIHLDAHKIICMDNSRSINFSLLLAP